MIGKLRVKSGAQVKGTILCQVRTGTRGQLSFLRPPRCMGLLRIFMRMGMKGSILAA